MSVACKVPFNKFFDFDNNVETLRNADGHQKLTIHCC